MAILSVVKKMWMLIIALLLLLLWYLSFKDFDVKNSKDSKDSPKENFDTYFNHDFGAHDVYDYDDKAVKTENKLYDVPAFHDKFKKHTPIGDMTSNLKAKYNWSKRDAEGYTVYDKYYINELKDEKYPRESLHVNLGTASHAYNTKFDTLAQTGPFAGPGTCSRSAASPRARPSTAAGRSAKRTLSRSRLASGQGKKPVSRYQANI